MVIKKENEYIFRQKTVDIEDLRNRNVSFRGHCFLGALFHTYVRAYYYFYSALFLYIRLINHDDVQQLWTLQLFTCSTNPPLCPFIEPFIAFFALNTDNEHLSVHSVFRCVLAHMLKKKTCFQSATILFYFFRDACIHDIALKPFEGQNTSGCVAVHSSPDFSLIDGVASSCRFLLLTGLLRGGCLRNC